jgi:hypothetical protein
MAGRTQVELISEALGNSTLSGAATEATLQDLLKAMNEYQQAQAELAKNAGIFNQALNVIKAPIRSVERGIKGVTAPLTGFVNNLNQGRYSFSDFADHMNSTVIKHVPIVGGILGTFVGMISGGSRILESWDRGARSVSPLGASFGNDMLQFRSQAAAARLSVDEFGQFVTRNIDKFNTLGATTDSGLIAYRSFIHGILDSGSNVRTELTRMGYTTRDINEVAVEFLSLTQRSLQTNGRFSDGAAEGMLEYAKRQTMLQRLLGDKNRQQNAGAQELMQNNLMMINLNRITDRTVRGNIIMGAEELTRLWGPGINTIFGGLFGLGSTLDQSGNTLRLLFPASERMVQRVLDLSGRSTPAEMTAALDDLLVDGIYNAARSAGGINNLLASISSGESELTDLYRTITPILTNIEQFGEGSELSKEQIRQALLKARMESGFTDSLTALIRSFTVMAQQFSTGLLDGLLAGLQTLDLGLSQTNLAENMERLGAWTANWLENAWKNISEFLQHARSPEGRTYMARMMGIWYNNYKDRFRLALEYGLSQLLGDTAGSIVGAVLPGFQYRSTEEYEQGQRIIRTRAVMQTALQNYALGGGPDFQAVPEGYSAPAGTQVNFDFLGGFSGTNDLATQQDLNYGAMTKGADGVWRAESAGGLGVLDFFASIFGDTFRMYAEEADIIRMLESRAYLQSSVDTGNPDLAPVFYGDTHTLANRKYADFFQNILMYLAGYGVPLNSVSIFDPNSTRPYASVGASMSINNGMDILNALTLAGGEQASNDFVAYLRRIGYIGTDDLEILSRGIISAGRRTGNPDGPHTNPNQFRFGTLGQTGSLFKDFGRGTPAVLHGNEAVVTKDQMSNLVSTSNQIPIKNLVVSLNTHINSLIDITRGEIRTTRGLINAA